jgi:hypothetical protein
VGAAAGIWDVMKNGLYSIHVTLLDGRTGKGSGVILFRDGQILGGDAYLFYTGSYTVKGDTFKGEVLVQGHTTPRDNDNPLFGGPNPVGIGVSGTFTDTRGSMNGTALVGKASQIFGATLRKLADINSRDALLHPSSRAQTRPPQDEVLDSHGEECGDAARLRSMPCIAARTMRRLLRRLLQWRCTRQDHLDARTAARL